MSAHNVPSSQSSQNPSSTQKPVDWSTQKDGTKIISDDQYLAPHAHTLRRR